MNSLNENCVKIWPTITTLKTRQPELRRDLSLIILDIEEKIYNNQIGTSKHFCPDVFPEVNPAYLTFCKIELHFELLRDPAGHLLIITKCQPNAKELVKIGNYPQF